MLNQIATLVLLFWCGSLSASMVDNPNRFPLGEQEALIGNAGAALTGSSGAVFFNPSALTTISGNKISLSGSTYLIFNYFANPITNFDNTNLNLGGGGFTTLPTSFVSIFKSSGWTFAFSVLQPDVALLNVNSPWQTPNFKITDINTETDTDLWLGFSAARKIDEQLSLGVSAYAIQHTEFTQSTINFDDISLPNTIVVSSSQKNATVYDIEIILGALYKVSPDLTLGVKVQTPTIPVSGSASYYNLSQTVASGVVTTAETSQASTNYQYQLPLDFTLGASYQLLSHLRVLLSASEQLPDHYSTSTDPNIGEPVATDATLRGNLGFIYQLDPKFSLNAGGFINPSTIHNLYGQPLATTREDFYNVTAGILYESGPVRSGIGAFYLFSSGQSLISATTLGSVSTQVYGALLTTSYIF